MKVASGQTTGKEMKRDVRKRIVKPQSKLNTTKSELIKLAII
jgi:hypothetical protein